MKAPPHHNPAGGFRNPWPQSTTLGFGGMLRWWHDRLRNPPPPDAAQLLPHTVGPAFERPRAAPERLTMTWVGHSTFLLQLGGMNLLTDPIWSDRCSPVGWAGPRRWVPPGIPFDELPSIDVVLLSHDHYDHLDATSVTRLAARNPEARWFVPLGLAGLVRRLGVRAVSELDWWEQEAIASLTIGCTPAQHFSGRRPWQRDRTLWCGWSAATAGRRLLFVGDTGYHPEFARIGERFGPFDVILVPIGAYEPRWFMQPVHMDPEEAIRACVDLRGAAAEIAYCVPMHWGTFKLTDEPMDEPPRRAREAWDSARLPRERFWQLAHGESRAL